MAVTTTLPDDLRQVMLGKVRTTQGAIGPLLVGSAARGSMDRNSDWDFVCVIDDDVPWPKPFRDGGRETFASPDGRQVEVAFASVARLRKRMAEQANEGIIAIAEFLAEGAMIWATGSKAQALKAEARVMRRRRPGVISGHELQWKCYEIWNQVKDVEDTLDDRVAGYYLSFLPYWNLVVLYFRLARRWLPRPKAVFTEIQKVDVTLYRMCSEFANASSNGTRNRVLREFMEYLAREFEVEFERYYTSPALSPTSEE